MKVVIRVAAMLAIPLAAVAQTTPRSPVAPPADPLTSVPNLTTLAKARASELASVVSRYSADLSSINRRYDGPDSPDRRQRMRQFFTSWRTRLGELDFNGLSQEGKVDYVLLDNELVYELALLDRRDKQRAETAMLLPFADRLLALHDARRNLVDVDPPAAARALNAVIKAVDSLRTWVESNRAGRPMAEAGGNPWPLNRTAANRAADDLDQVHGAMTAWFRFYDGYDPQFTWWVKDPWGQLDLALTRYARAIRERIVGLPPRPRPSPAPAAARDSPPAPPMTAPVRSSAIPSAPKVSPPISATK